MRQVLVEISLYLTGAEAISQNLSKAGFKVISAIETKIIASRVAGKFLSVVMETDLSDEELVTAIRKVPGILWRGFNLSEVVSRPV